jgi:hypothetical protein
MLAIRLAPARILVAGSVVAVAVFLFDIWLARSTPWLGLEFDAPAAGEGIVVARVFDQGPAEGKLEPGDVIAAIEARDGALLPLSAVTISRVPYSLSTYAAFNRFFADHRALWSAINEEAVTLVRADGTRTVLHPNRQRSLASLPVDFWAMVVLATIAMLIGSGVLAFKPTDAAPRMFFVACVGLTLTSAMMALGKGRELAMSTDWVQLLWPIDQFGKYLAFFAFVALLWVYPRRFRPTKHLVPVGGLFFGVWLAGEYQWWPSAAWPPAMTGAVFFLGLIPLSAWQWRATRAHPADRAALKVLLLALLIPFGSVVLANSVPVMLGLKPPIASGFGLASYQGRPPGSALIFTQNPLCWTRDDVAHGASARTSR